jgi:hypothetical protein
LIFVIALAALLGGAGCVAKPTEDPDHDAILKGVITTLHAAGSATADFDVAISGHETQESARWVGTSQLRFGERTDRGTTARLTVRPPGFPRASDIPRPVSVEVVAIGPLRYHRSDAVASPDGRSWARFEAGQFRTYSGALTLIRLADPDLGLLDPETYLAVAGGSAESAGVVAALDSRDDTIDGVPVRSYSLFCVLAVDPCPSPATLVSGARNPFRGENRIEATFWIDDQGRPRRVKGAAVLAVAGSIPTLNYRIDFTIDIGKFGEPVTIVEPDPASVAPGITRGLSGVP